MKRIILVLLVLMCGCSIKQEPRYVDTFLPNVGPVILADYTGIKEDISCKPFSCDDGALILKCEDKIRKDFWFQLAPTVNPRYDKYKKICKDRCEKGYFRL